MVVGGVSFDGPTVWAGGGKPPDNAPPLVGTPQVIDVADTLTANDKRLTGFSPDHIDPAATAIATYRANGLLTGEVSQAFVDAIHKFIAQDALRENIKLGGFPANPAMLMAMAPGQASLSSDTFAALAAATDGAS